MPSLKIFGKFAFSVCLLSTIFYLIDTHDLVVTLMAADVQFVIVAVGFALSAQLFSAFRLQRLAELQEISLTCVRVFFIGLSATFYGLFLPGGSVAALAVRFFQLSQEARVEAVAAMLILDRVIATASLIAIGAVAISFDQAGLIWAVAVLAGMLLVAIGTVYGQRNLPRLMDWVESNSSGNLPGILHRTSVRVGGAFEKYSSADSGEFHFVVGVTLLAHFSGCLMYFAISESLGLNFTLLSIVWIRSGMILFTMIPMSVAGLGLREVAGIVLLAPLGLGEAQAVGFALLIFLVTPVIIGLLGGLAELYRVAYAN
jgi:uncharacterized protein (TIRG00374 family)